MYYKVSCFPNNNFPSMNVATIVHTFNTACAILYSIIPLPCIYPPPRSTGQVTTSLCMSTPSALSISSPGQVHIPGVPCTVGVHGCHAATVTARHNLQSVVGQETVQHPQQTGWHSIWYMYIVQLYVLALRVYIYDVCNLFPPYYILYFSGMHLTMCCVAAGIIYHSSNNLHTCNTHTPSLRRNRYFIHMYVYAYLYLWFYLSFPYKHTLVPIPACTHSSHLCL